MRGHRAVDVPADQADHVGPAAQTGGEADRPGLGRIGVHPCDAHFDRRVVLDNQRLAARLCIELRTEPRRARFAKCAAVAAFFQRIQHQDAHCRGLDGVLQEAAGKRRFGENIGEVGAFVVVPKGVVDREGQARKRFRQALVARPVAAVDQVAGGEQHVRARHHCHQFGHDPVKPLAIEFARAVRFEAEVDIGDLRDQHPAVPSASIAAQADGADDPRLR